MSCVAALAAALAAASGAQQPPPHAPPGDSTAFHVVRSGDTLEDLTAAYLGDASRWRENWALNPELKDPHQLRVGQRIVIMVGPKQHRAEIQGLSRRVESKPHPDPAWIAARVGEVLRERDGVRTYAKSSADLGFDDGSHLLVTEQSLVFLRETGPRLVGTVSRRSIEILDGQADIQAKAAPTLAAGLEIIVGGARADAQPVAGHGMDTRARAGGGGAQVMVYQGTSSVASGGHSVVVPGGMGTSVPKDGPPAAPERLLPAPHVLVPSAGAAFGQANPRFSWRPVTGAASYVVEVCQDVACGQLVDRATGVTRTSWEADGLPLGDLYFRVSAVARSGLDGFASPATPFRIESLWRRPEPIAQR